MAVNIDTDTEQDKSVSGVCDQSQLRCLLFLGRFLVKSFSLSRQMPGCNSKLIRPAIAYLNIKALNQWSAS
jgi:hypothetical protein